MTYGHTTNGQRLIEEVKKYKDWNLIVYFLVMKALLTEKNKKSDV